MEIETQERKREPNSQELRFNGAHYDPIGAIRFHFKEFYVWVGFFIVINGTLLTVYYTVRNNPFYSILVALLGCITAFLCFCSSQCYYRCIKKLSELIDGKSNKNTRPFFRPLEFAKVTTIKIVSSFIAITTYFWGLLLLENIAKCMKDPLPTFVTVVIVILCVTVIELLSWWCIKELFECHLVKEKPKRPS